MERDEAYASSSAPRRRRGTVARRSATPWSADPDVQAALDRAQLDALFDPSRFLRNAGGVFEKLEKLPVEEG